MLGFYATRGGASADARVATGLLNEGFEPLSVARLFGGFVWRDASREHPIVVLGEIETPVCNLIAVYDEIRKKWRHLFA